MSESKSKQPNAVAFGSKVVAQLKADPAFNRTDQDLSLVESVFWENVGTMEKPEWKPTKNPSIPCILVTVGKGRGVRINKTVEAIDAYIEALELYKKNYM